MSLLRFDGAELVRQLERLSPLLRVAFAAACAERLFPAYPPFAERSGRGGPRELALMLERLWQDLEGDPMDPDELQRALDRCETLIPDEDEGGWVEGQAQAEDAAAALAYALDSRHSGSAQAAALAGRRAYEALEHLVINREGIDLTRPTAEEQVLSHPLISAELARQHRDLDELLGVTDETGIPGIVSRLRDRARAEASAVFG
jgi:uncharacterized protein YjaG (DUF416 family)